MLQTFKSNKCTRLRLIFQTKTRFFAEENLNESNSFKKLFGTTLKEVDIEQMASDSFPQIKDYLKPLRKMSKNSAKKLFDKSDYFPYKQNTKSVKFREDKINLSKFSKITNVPITKIVTLLDDKFGPEMDIGDGSHLDSETLNKIKKVVLNKPEITELSQKLHIEAIFALDKHKSQNPKVRKSQLFAKMAKKKTRPPLLCILGHVDHGKTTLLDKLRSSSAAAEEPGGITQSVGAFPVKLGSGEEMIILDTPGHEAFKSMRELGVTAVDGAILVIAADDGPMPTTVESLRLLRESKVPFVVALNKVDLPNIDFVKIKRKMADLELFSEEDGGDCTIVKISALKKQNLDELMSLAYLNAMINEPKANYSGPAKAVIIEVKTSLMMGVELNIVVLDGELSVGDFFVVGMIFGRVKKLKNSLGECINSATPGTPVTLWGIKQIPSVGQKLQVFKDSDFAKEDILRKKKILELYNYQKSEENLKEREKAKKILRAEKIQKAKEVEIKDKKIVEILKKKKNKILSKNEKKLFNEYMKQKREDFENEKRNRKEEQEINFIIKTGSRGAAETMQNLFNSLIVPDNEIKINTVKISVGTVQKADVNLAVETKAKLLTFGTEKPREEVYDLTKMKNIEINHFDVFYSISDFIR
ncbi:hypothetical protein MHBO_001549, partial [Bonamia ostreae]